MGACEIMIELDVDEADDDIQVSEVDIPQIPYPSQSEDDIGLAEEAGVLDNVEDEDAELEKVAALAEENTRATQSNQLLTEDQMGLQAAGETTKNEGT